MQTSFCKKLTLSVLALISVQQASALNLRKNLKDARDATFTCRAIFFRDLVAKKFFHKLVEKLPNQHIVSLRNASFDVHDVAKSISDAMANVLDAHLFAAKGADWKLETKLALFGTIAHKLFEELIDIAGLTEHTEDLKEHYELFGGKAWFSRAFALAIDDALHGVAGFIPFGSGE